MITDLTLGENIFNSPDLSIKMKILHAVNKSLDQITVAEICRNARDRPSTGTSRASMTSPGGTPSSAASSI